MMETLVSLRRQLLREHSIVISQESFNYRKLAQHSWGLTDEQMIGMHVHHHPPRSQGGRNIPEHLYVCSLSVHYIGWHKGTRGNHHDCFHMVSYETRVENGRKVGTKHGKEGGSKSRPSEFGRLAMQKNARRQGKRNSKPIVVTHVASQESFLFPSVSEAGRFLGVNAGNLATVARLGGSTVGFFAIYFCYNTSVRP